MVEKKFTKETIAKEEIQCYNTDTEFAADSDKKEEKTMAELLERMKNYEVPPHIAKQLGLEKNWKENVSPEFLQQVLKSVSKYHDVLKRLSDK